MLHMNLSGNVWIVKMRKESRIIIGERPLLYSKKGESERVKFSICLFQPYLLTREDANYRFGEQDIYVCELNSVGLAKPLSHEVFASDSIRAVHMASGAVDFFVRQINNNFDVFWSDGDPYFEEQR